MLTILFACRNFDMMAGGVEKMSTLIMNDMVKRGHKVFLLTWDHSNAVSHYSLNPKIQWIKLNLGKPNIKADYFLRIKRQIIIRKYIKEINPSLVIGFQVGTFIAMRLASFGLSIPFIAAERNSRDLFKFQSQGIKKRILASIALFFSDKITIQFENYRYKYPFFLRSKIITIPNPVNPNKNPSFPNELKNPPKRILNVGRLSNQKNQLFLIKSFSLIAQNNPDWILTIVGEGEYRSTIEQLILEKGLQNRIELIGAVRDVDRWYQKSSFFAFPSLWEGFPNALAEAFREGLPAIGLLCTSGVNQLIIQNKNGLLTSNCEVKFSNGLQEMIDKPIFRQKAGRFAINSVNKYKPELIFNKWEKIFLDLSKDQYK